MWTRWSLPTRLGLGVLTAVVVGPTAHAQVFYNAGLDARTKAALEQYEASKKAHLAYLDSRLAEIDRQQTLLATAVTETTLAERDFLVIAILGEDERKSAADRLRGSIAARINAIIPEMFVLQGCTGADCRSGRVLQGRDFARVNAVLPGLDAPRSDSLRLATSDIEQTEVALMKRLGAKRPTGGVALPAAGWSLGWFCRDVFPSRSDSATADQRTQAFIQNVLVGQNGMNPGDALAFGLLASSRCGDIVAARSHPKFDDITARPTRQALLALGGWGDDADTIDEAPPITDPIQPALELGRQIAQIKRRTMALEAELKETDALARALKKRRDALVKTWVTSATQEEIAHLAGCFAQLLADKAQTACAKEPDGSSDSNIESLFAALDVLTNLADTGPELQRLRQEEAFEVVQYLSDPKALRAKAEASCSPAPASAASPSKDEEEQLRRLCITDAVVRTADIVERAGEIRQGIPGQIAMLAVQLADADLKSASIRLRAAALTDRATNLDAQRRALLAECKSLMEAYVRDAQAAGADPALLDRGVFRLADTFSHGRLSYELQVSRYGFIGQREFAQRERAITSGRYAISDALLSTLASSTAGGVKPEQVAGVISALGLTAVGITEAVK